MNCSIDFFEKTTPPTLGGAVTFAPLVHFNRFFSAIDAQKQRLHLLFGHHNNGAFMQKQQETSNENLQLNSHWPVLIENRTENQCQFSTDE
jgi:hypothetical protein